MAKSTNKKQWNKEKQRKKMGKRNKLLRSHLKFILNRCYLEGHWFLCDASHRPSYCIHAYYSTFTYLWDITSLPKRHNSTYTNTHLEYAINSCNNLFRCGDIFAGFWFSILKLRILNEMEYDNSNVGIVNRSYRNSFVASS